MKIILLVTLCFMTLFGTKIVEVEKRYQKSQSCKACHLKIVQDWEKSWHAQSHYKNDEYFRATIDYVSRKARKSINSVKVQCATCHNPRISVSSTDIHYEIDVLMKLDKGSKVNTAIKSDAINEGINCVVCHNVDKIHDEYNASKRGINRVKWTDSGTMTGPFADAKSPYHKIVYHEFMDKSQNKLCFVCHANDKGINNRFFTNMQEEYKGKQSCTECHMGRLKQGVAATYKMYGGKAKLRPIRSHSFEGAHTSSMWKDALGLQLVKKNTNVVMTISNPQPHNLPSGFGSREIIIDVVYRKEKKILESKVISLTKHYTRRKDKPTIAHLAEKESKDRSIPAHGELILKTPIVEGATSVEVTLSYRLVNNEVHKLLKLKEAIWSQKSFIVKRELLVSKFISIP